MISGLNRLSKLANNCTTFEDFKAKAIARSYWYLRPYVSQGVRVDAPWIARFWEIHKLKGV